MTRALMTFPLPKVLVRGLGMRAVPLRALLATAGPLHVFVERGEGVLGIRNVPPTVKAAVGVADVRGYRHALVASPGDLVDYRAALSVLSPHLETHLLPLYANDAPRMEDAYESLRERFSGPAPVAAGDERLLARTLREHAARQLTGACTSPDWRRFLLGLLTGTHPEPPELAPAPERARVALMGALAGPSDLLDYIEVFGGRVVYDEWAQLAAELTYSSQPFADLTTSPLLCGLQAREARLREIENSVDAVVLVVEPFCALAMEEAWLRSAIRKPLLVVEADGPGHLDATRVMRLENFSALAFQGGGSV